MGDRTKVVALVRTSAADADRNSIWSTIERSATDLGATGAADPNLADSASATSALTGLVVSKVTSAFAEGDPLVALVELWGEGIDADGLIDRIVPAALRERGGLEVTTATCSEMVFREVTDYARPGSPWQVKLAGTAFRRDDFTPDAFFDYWANVHAPIGGSVPGVGGYTVSRLRSGQLGSEQADAIIEQWYPSAQAFSDAQSTEPAKAAWNDVGNYAKTTGTVFWLMTESVIIQPPATGPGTLEA